MVLLIRFTAFMSNSFQLKSMVSVAYWFTLLTISCKSRNLGQKEQRAGAGAFVETTIQGVLALKILFAPVNFFRPTK